MSRGLWLAFLEVTVVRCLGWSFNFDFHEIGLLVIWALGWSMVFGRVPLFFYLLHLPLMHGMAVGLSYLKYGRADWLFLGSAGIPIFGAAYPRDYGYGLPAVYLIWLLVVVTLYPLCRWFARVKQERRSVCLSYL